MEPILLTGTMLLLIFIVDYINIRVRVRARGYLYLCIHVYNNTPERQTERPYCITLHYAIQQAPPHPLFPAGKKKIISKYM